MNIFYAQVILNFLLRNYEVFIDTLASVTDWVQNSLVVKPARENLTKRLGDIHRERVDSDVRRAIQVH